jgi:NAD(P)-dependent dehydrogenase (short-subunit alcohol dehydrogenase family)
MGMLDGHVVIVTGGGRGIGRSHCLELASHGATVVVNDLGAGVHGEGRDESPAEEVVREIEKNGGTAVADGTSVTDWDAVGALVKGTAERFGRLDAVVNNAGVLRDRMLTSMSEEDLDVVLAVHVKGTFAVAKHACDHWRAVAKAGGSPRGRIINTTSGSGLFGNVGQSNYGAAKAAIATFTITTAMEMDRYAVTCNAISPMALTRMTQNLTGTAGSASSDTASSDTAGSSSDDGGSSPAWEPLDPANSSPVVAWLASPSSGWLSGAILRVDGNTVMRVRPWEIDTDVQYRSQSGERLTAKELDAGMRKAFRTLPAGLSSSLLGS